MSMQLTKMINLDKGYSKFLSSISSGTSSAIRNITSTSNALVALDRSIMAINKSKIKKPTSNIIDVDYKEVPPVNLNKGYTKFLDSVLGKSSRVLKSITSTSHAISILDKSIMAISHSKVKRPKSDIIDVDYKEVPSEDKQKDKDEKEPKKGSTLLKYAKGLVSKDNLINGMKLADEYMGVYAKINLMNDGLQSTDELQNKIFASANESRTSYQDMASHITQMNASGAFANNDELINFTELAQKSFKLGGASSEEQSAGMGQLTEAMSAGTVGEDQLSGIMDGAPKIAEAITTYTGKSKEELRSMAAEGGITSDTIKNAMFAMSADINGDFDAMPKKFSDIWTQIKNTALQALGPVIKGFAELISSDGFQALVSMMCTGINMIGQGLSWIVQGAIQVAEVIASNWSWIGPVLWGIIAAIIAYNAVSMITNGILTIQTVIEGIKQATMAAEAGATFLATAAQQGLNAALLACPITWIIIAVVALIAIFYVVIGIINQLTGSSISATGCIVAAFMWVAATIGNVLIGAYNLVIDVISVIWNYIANFAEFFANVFNDPIGSIVRLFVNMADSVLQVIESIASACDTLFGTNFAETIGGWRAGLNDISNKLVGEAEIKVKRMDASAARLDRIDTGKAAEKGYGWGENIDNFDLSKLGFDTDFLKSDPDIPSFEDPSKMPKEMGVTNVGGQPLDVAVDQDDIKYIQDLAERDYIAKFGTATLAPNITVSFGDIHETVNANQVKGHVERILREEIAMVAEG